DVRVGRDDAGEVAVADDPDAGWRLHLRLVERGQRRLERRRAQDLSVEHAGTRQVGGVLVRAGDEVAPVHLWHLPAGDLPLGGRREGRRRDAADRRERADELLAARELAVGEGAVGRGVRDLAVRRGEAVARDAPALRGEVDELLARGGGGA